MPVFLDSELMELSEARVPIRRFSRFIDIPSFHCFMMHFFPSNSTMNQSLCQTFLTEQVQDVLAV